MVIDGTETPDSNVDAVAVAVLLDVVSPQPGVRWSTLHVTDSTNRGGKGRGMYTSHPIDHLPCIDTGDAHRLIPTSTQLTRWAHPLTPTL
jgi:hypothetical protein